MDYHKLTKAFCGDERNVLIALLLIFSYTNQLLSDFPKDSLLLERSNNFESALRGKPWLVPCCVIENIALAPDTWFDLALEDFINLPDTTP